MGIITRMRIHDAIYWGPPTPDGLGNVSFPAPVAIRCRWDDVTEIFAGAGGEEVSSNAIVYVDRDMVVGGYLQKGTLADLDSSGDTDPLGYLDAREIRRFDKIDKIKLSPEKLRTCYL